MDNEFNYSHPVFVKMGSSDPTTEPSRFLKLHSLFKKSNAILQISRFLDMIERSSD
jgi:hypothetical protein